MKLLNPYVWLIAVAVLLATAAGAYWWGHTAAATSCAAKNGAASSKVERKEDRRDAKIEAIGAATATETAGPLAANRVATDESVERLRTVYVPAACRPDPVVMRELRQARDDANATLGVGVRPSAAGSAAADH